MPLVGVRGVVRVRTGFLEQPRQGFGAGEGGPELLDVDARRHLVHALDVADDVLEHCADVRGADEDRTGAGERLGAEARELRSAAHRVLELRAVRLHRVGAVQCRSHRASGQDVVGEDEVGGQEIP